MKMETEHVAYVRVLDSEVVGSVRTILQSSDQPDLSTSSHRASCAG